MASQDCPTSHYVEIEILTGPDAGSREVVMCTVHGDGHSGRLWWSGDDEQVDAASDDGTGDVAPSATEAPQAPAEQEVVCAYDVGDLMPCRCLLPRGHAGMHQCKHCAPSPRPDTADDEGVRRG